MQFDVILTNPPFQDSTKRGKTPHKLWIDFTKRNLAFYLKSGGVLGQISPSSFQSPSSKILELIRQKNVSYIDFTTSLYFPEIGSSFAHYIVKNEPRNGRATVIKTHTGQFSLIIDGSIFYLPNDLCETSMNIHKKFIFDQEDRLSVKWDYVTCHNILLKKDQSLSKVKSRRHKYPVLHTNSQIWWSAIRQDWASKQKVMWSRSGYFKPVFDDGYKGGTDMVYYVLVNSRREGEQLAHNLNLNLPQYIMKSAKWSGFGNEKVFAKIPTMPAKKLTDSLMYSEFGLTKAEVEYVETFSKRTKEKA